MGKEIKDEYCMHRWSYQMKYKIMGSVLALLLTSISYGAVSGKLIGKVSDEDGEPLQGVNVFLEGETMGASTDIDGNYVILNVPPGTYSLKSSMIGYTDITVTNVIVSVNLTTTINFELDKEVLEGEQVTVVAERELLREDEFTSRHSVSAEEIEIQPIDDFMSIARNQAGVVGSHFRGGRSNEILVLVDGIALRDPAGAYSGEVGGFTASIPEQAIQELEVTLGGFSAEYGNVQSGVLNLAMKEGDSRYHGKFKVSTTDLGSNLNDALMGSRNTWGGIYDQYYNTDSVLVDTLVHGNRYQHKLLNIYQLSLSGPLPLNSSFAISAEVTDKPQGYFLNQQYYSQSLQGKFSFKFSPKLKFVLGGLYSESVWDQFYFPASKYGPAPDYPVNEYRYLNDSTLYVYEYVNNPDEFDQGITTPDSGHFESVFFDTTVTYYVAGMQEYLWDREQSNATGYAILTHNISSRTFYELRFQSTSSNYHYATVDIDDRNQDGNVSEELIWNWNPSLGDDGNAHPIYREREDNYWWLRGDDPGYRDQTSWSRIIKGDITSQVTFNHMLKFGFELGLHRTKVENISWTLGYGSFRQDIWDENSSDFGAYIQDKMEFKGITALVGLRYDRFDPNGWGDDVNFPADYEYPYTSTDTAGIPIIIDPQTPALKAQLSPRIGISHPITDRDVLHFTYGHYFQRPDAYYLYRNYKIQSLTKVGNYVGNPDLEPEKTVSYDFGLEHLITNTIKVSVTGYYKDITNLIDWYKYVGRSLQGKELNVYTNADFGNVKGLEFAFIKQFSGFWGCSVNYTYSIAKGRSSSPSEGAGTFSSAKKMTLLDFDQTHTLNANLTLLVPDNPIPFLSGWRSNFQIKYGSGLPYTSSGSNTINDARLPEKFKVDMRLNKKFILQGDFSVDLFMDVYNLLNRENIDWIGSAANYHKTGDYSITRLNELSGELVRNPQTLSEERQFRIGFSVQF